MVILEISTRETNSIRRQRRIFSAIFTKSQKFGDFVKNMGISWKIWGFYEKSENFVRICFFTQNPEYLAISLKNLEIFFFTKLHESGYFVENLAIFNEIPRIWRFCVNLFFLNPKNLVVSLKIWWLKKNPKNLVISWKIWRFLRTLQKLVISWKKNLMIFTKFPESGDFYKSSRI